MEPRLFFTRLMDWFSQSRRFDPWSVHSNSYAVWISEIMLQQTTVSVVQPYFEAWMARFPALSDVAKANEEEVLRMWEGLGYYSRARHIRKTAKLLHSRQARDLPRSYDELCKLPGIGDNTARAILSLAYGEKMPVLDANVRKIFMRLFLWKEWSKKNEKETDRLIREGMSEYSPREVNEALMQLGQLVCVRKNARCHLCPVISFCEAFRLEKQSHYPPPRAQKISLKKTMLFIPAFQGRIWLEKREKGIGKGMWSFRSLPEDKGTEILNAVQENPCIMLIPLSRRIHTYTRYRDELIPYLLSGEETYLLRSMGEPVLTPLSMEEAELLPFLAPYRKIIEEIKTLLKSGITL